MTTDERTRRIREVRQQLLRKGPPREPDSERFIKYTVPERDCDLIRDLLIAEYAETVVEVGLAYGSSALAIGEALVAIDPPDPRHLIIDPYQERDWAGIGMEMLGQAGLEAITRLVPMPSSLAFPVLIAEGIVADTAFVDGSHLFHEVVVELSFLQEVVRPNGLVIVDDYWASSVRSAVHYFTHNLGWKLIPDAFTRGSLISIDLDPGQELVTRCAALRLPETPVAPRFEDFRPFWPGSGSS